MKCDIFSQLNASLEEATHLHNQGHLDEAIARYKELLEEYPENPDLWNLLGVAAHQKDNNQLAEHLIRTALSLKTDVPDFYNNLGMVYRGLAREKEADQAFRSAVRLNPTHTKALSNLGSLLRQQGEFAAALDYARQAVLGNPEDTDALNNLGNAETDCGLVVDAVKTFRRAIAIQPDFALAHWNLALALLSLGDLKTGFDEMAWRWKWNKFPGFRRTFRQPLWCGENLLGKKILLHPEQGLGDTIHFLRYAKLIKELGGYVLLELPPALIPLTHHSSLGDEIVIFGDPLPDYDFHASFMDLPRILGTTLKNIPNELPYLLVDTDLQEIWRHRINKFEGMKIGLNWSGNMASPIEKFRGIPPDDLAPLSDLPGINWFSLQKGDDSKDAIQLDDKFKMIDTGPAPLSDTAALISEMNLIITTDTAVAHLAGALNKPVWILLHHAPDWRWLTSGDTNPWYPTVRLFRQTHPGNWADVIEKVMRILKNFKI